MKFPIIFLACVMLVALLNLGLDLRQSVRFCPMTTSGIVENSDTIFTARLAATDTSVKLRTLASREHARFLEFLG